MNVRKSESWKSVALIALLIVNIFLIAQSYIFDKLNGPDNEAIIRQIAREEIEDYLEYDLGSPYMMEKQVSYVIGNIGSYYYLLNGSTGQMDWYSTDADAIINAAIGNLTNGGSIFLKAGIYTIDSAIDFRDKAIILEGEGIGKGAVPSSYPVTKIDVANGMSDWVIKAGIPNNGASGVQIRNLIIDGKDSTTPLGGILFRNVQHGVIENIVINDFFGTSPMARAVYLYGDVEYGCYYNQLINIQTRRCTIGIEFGDLANANFVYGGDYSNNRDITTYGLYFNGGDTAVVVGGDYHDYKKSAAIAIYIKRGDAHKFFGVRFEENYKNVVIDSGAETGENAFIGGSTANLQTGGTAFKDNGNEPSVFRYISGFNTESSGTATIKKGASSVQFAHGLAGTPTIVIVTGRNTETDKVICSVRDATNITLSVPENVTADCVVDWYAEYKP